MLPVLCDFHQKQSWERWMRKTENNVGDDKENMLRLMRAIAQADNEMKFESAIMDLKESKTRKRNGKFRNYFDRGWMLEKEVRMP